MKALVNGDVYTPRRIIPRGVVLVSGARIADVGRPDQVTIPKGAERIDAGGRIICPGLVDIHLHGGDGADCLDGTVEAVRTVARRHLRAGTTSFVATTSSALLPQIWQAFDCIGQVMREPGPMEARVLGAEMEGPFLSIAQRGAHPPELLRMPNAAEREKLYSYIGDLVRLTIAPERHGALEIIAHLSQRGVLVCGGHSDALYEQVCLAMRAGLRHITHLWSCMSTVRRIGPKRYSGMLEAALVEDGLTADIITDGYHLPTSLIRIAYRMKGPEKLCLISDAIRASGMGSGEYQVSGRKAIVDEGGGVAVTPDRKAFAGSISTLQQCLRHVVQVVGISLREALEMSTLTPARILGVDDRIGQLVSGHSADLLVLDRATLDVQMVMLRGKVIKCEAS